MKKLLYTFLAASVIFSACEEEDAAPEANNNSNTGTIADVVGVWKFIGEYDALGNLQDYPNVDYENCVLQNTIILEIDENAIWTAHYLENEVSGPCLSQSQVFTYNYINSTTLEFAIPSACGNATVSLPSPAQFHIPTCNADNGAYDGGYMLYEMQ